MTQPFVLSPDPVSYTHLDVYKRQLLDKVNTIIADAKADGSLEALSQKWLKQPLPADL